MSASRPTSAQAAFARGHKLMVTDGSEPCRGLTDIFFPDRSRPSEAKADIEMAKRICAGCPTATRIQCTVGALRRVETDGIWGGIDFFVRNNPASKERQQTRRARAERSTVTPPVRQLQRPTQPPQPTTPRSDTRTA